MVQINFAQKEIQCKIVYYGPGMSGKTTNLELVHGKVPANARGELTSIATTGERTLYFDYMPLDLGQIAGIQTKFQLYTVPGQIYYKATRRLVLQGVDGIVFVADSSASKMRENKESLADLEENLQEMGKSTSDVPIVIQYNKRDIPDAMSVEELEKELNPAGFPHYEAVATRGDGVFPTLKKLAGIVLENVNQGSLARSKPKVPRPTPVAAHAARRSPVAASAAGTAVAAPRPAPKVDAGPPPAPKAPAARGHGGAPRGAVPRGAAPPPDPTPPRPAGSHAHPPLVGRTPPATHATTGRMSLEDRMVNVNGLSRGESRAKLPIFLLLLGLIGGAVFFALSRIL